MLDETKIGESKKRVEFFIKEGKIIKEKEGRYIDFFIDNSKDSFNSAKLLFDVSTKEKLKNYLGFSDFNGFLWVVNTSYYSMFYMVRALLESKGIKIKTDFSVHALVFDAFIYYFYTTGKIEKSLIEEFRIAGIEAAETLGKEKAKTIVYDYFNEKEKRSKFTYEMGEIALQNKAQSSLERAKRFNEEIRKIIGK